MAQLFLRFEDADGATTYEVLVTPYDVDVEVGNGDVDEAVTFNLYDSTTGEWLDLLSTETDEYGYVACAVPLPTVAAGDYELEVAGTTSTTSARLPFTIVRDALDETDDPDDEALPDLPATYGDPGTWRLVDLTPTAPRTYQLTRNPSRWTNPERPSFLEHEVTTAPDGNVLAWQGPDRSWTFEFSGYLDTQAEYEELEFWAGLRRRFWLIDHRERARFVTFEHFDARARIVPNVPWAHDYTIRVVHFYRSDLEVV
jgi:hypothetical protein